MGERKSSLLLPCGGAGAISQQLKICYAQVWLCLFLFSVCIPPTPFLQMTIS